MSGIGKPTPLPDNDGDRTLYAVFERSTGRRVEIVHRVWRGRHTAQVVALRPGYAPFVISIAQVAELIDALVEIQASIREAHVR